ncbi:hypothetical protein [Streptomyces sp. NPDC048172]|uniref:DUF7919 family protein n=1 Tax=Streptomyces sp. NPDC048172 TaxID=3365505 RepID=UPI00371E57F6
MPVEAAPLIGSRPDSMSPQTLIYAKKAQTSTGSQGPIMAEYADNSPYSYQESPIPYLNIGWLGKDTGIPQSGPLAPESCVTILRREAQKARGLSLGTHECEFCTPAEAPVGNGEVHFYGRSGEAYAAPTLVAHYIEQHGYTPPPLFVQAVHDAGRNEWNASAESLKRIADDPSQELARRVDALLDLRFWKDPRAEESILEAAKDDEISLIAEYEIAMCLATVWARHNTLDHTTLAQFSEEVRETAESDFTRLRQDVI